MNECLPHPLVGRGLYDERRTPRIIGIRALSTPEKTLYRESRRNLAHHLVVSLRSCSCAADQILLFSRLYVDEGDQLFVDALFHNRGGWASREKNCSANAPTCEVWLGCVIVCSATVPQQRFMDVSVAAYADVAATEEAQLVPCEQKIYITTVGRDRKHLSCALALRTDIGSCVHTVARALGCRPCTPLPFHSPCC